MKQLISIVLIFIMVFPVLIFACTSSVYAFGGLELNSTFARILESLLALFFLDKLFNSDSKEAMSDNKEDLNQNSKLDWKRKKISNLTINEEKMLELINEARQKKDLAPLQIDYRLVKIAREKCRDMIRNDYFSHQSPTYGSPFNMFKTMGINYYLAGENIAGAPEVKSAHQELMGSKKHRENILDSNYTHVGLGIIAGGRYGKMYAQEFVDLKK